MACRCKAPLLKYNTRSCLRCFKAMDVEAFSCDRTIRAFYDRLGSSVFPGWGRKDFTPPPEWVRFRAQAEAREKDGREKFGQAYLSRDNLAEAGEEEVDGANYRFFDMLQSRHRTGRFEDTDLVFEGARHAYMAYKCDRQLAAKRRGSP